MREKNTWLSNTSIAAIIFLLTAVWALIALRYPGPASEEIALFQAARQEVSGAVSGTSASVSPLLVQIYKLLHYPGSLWAGQFESWRTGAALFFALTAALLFLWIADKIGHYCALAASALFVLTPRAFAAGIQATQFPALALLTYLAAIQLERFKSRAPDAAIFGITLGLGMAVSSYFLMAWLCLAVWTALSGRIKEKAVLLAAGAAGILVLPVLLNPSWWTAPLSAYGGWLRGNVLNCGDYRVPVQYFGELFQRSVPWHYVIVMLVVGMPVALVVLAIGGKFVSLRPEFFRGPAGFALCTSTGYILVAMTGRFPAAEGLTFFLPLFAADAIMAGYTLNWFLRRNENRSRRISGLARVGLLLLLLAPPAVLQARLFPCLSSHYNAIIGFLGGAQRAGLEVCFDCSPATGEFMRSVEKTFGGQDALLSEGVPLEFFKGTGIVSGKLRPGAQVRLVLLNRPGTWSQRERKIFSSREPLLKVEREGVLLLGVFDSR